MIVKHVFKKGKKISFVIMFLLGFLMTIGMNAQSGKSAIGVFKDDTGFPIPRVNLIEKGTKNSASSDIDGKFSIKLVSDKAVLVVS